MNFGPIHTFSDKLQVTAEFTCTQSQALHGKLLHWCVLLMALMLFSGCTHSTTNEPLLSVSVPSRLVSIDDFTFEGAFALPDDEFGESNANYAEGVIEVNGSSMYLIGHKHHDAIAEFTIPALRKSSRISELKNAGRPKQPFTQPLLRAPGGNPEKLDQIVGLELFKGRLFGNAVEYYDAPGDNKQSTFVIQDASAIATAPMAGFYSLGGKARATGWLSSVPTEWRQALGCTHISGHSSGGPIISRHSVGPSAFCVDLDTLITKPSKRSVKTTELLGFSLGRPLTNDLTNDYRDNGLWTHLSQARFGYIVPGTSTYATFGTSGGHNTGVGYKLMRKNGKFCGGYCATEPDDVSNYYWFWDMRDLLKVKAGKLAASAVKPYASGVFNVPFQTSKYVNAIGGGSYDEQTGLLYLSVTKANNTLGEYSNPPIIAAFKVAK